MNVHKLLKRQLEKTELSTETKPESTKAWIKFLNHVNQFYQEADQERYLQERSMQISSREMMFLNERLEKAQQIAKLGYWSYDGQSDHKLWSKELYNLFHYKKTHAPPNLNEFLNWIHEADRHELKQNFQKAFSQKINFEKSIRVNLANREFRWFQIVAQCNKENSILTGILMDIHENKAALEEINQLNQRLILTARQAVMTEVAASILHNIGNTLNTFNIALDTLKNNALHNFLQKLTKINKMMLMHQDDLGTFLKQDPKGRLIPEYINRILKYIPEEKTKFDNELSNLEINIQHIKDVVSSQKLISGLDHSIHVKIYVPELMETILNIVMISDADKKIIIEKKYESSPSIEIDKSKLIHILINVIRNARDAVFENDAIQNQKITLGITLLKNNFISIIVSDNGIGIKKENLERIFSFGFTTKKEGHGFGLHSAALSAQQMGGKLIAQSKGLKKGAKFILNLPVTG